MKGPEASSEANAVPYGTFALHGYRLWMYRAAQSFPRHPFFFRLSLLLRKLALRDRPTVDADPLGIRSRFYPFQNLGDRFVLFSPSYYEDEEREYLRSRLRPGHVFVDIGANMGFYSLIAARSVMPGGRVLAFEPNPVMTDRLRTNAAFNQCEKQIEVFPYGIADRNGAFRLAYQENNMGSGSIVPHSQRSEAVEIECRTFQSVLEQLGIQGVEVLKIDIEGGETSALGPFFESAPRKLWPKCLLIESDEGLALKERGYRFVKRTHSHNSIYELSDA